MTIKQIINELKNGEKIQNGNTEFFITSDNKMIMCEITKDYKYTMFLSLDAFASRVMKFYKTSH